MKWLSYLGVLILGSAVGCAGDGDSNTTEGAGASTSDGGSAGDSSMGGSGANAGGGDMGGGGTMVIDGVTYTGTIRDAVGMTGIADADVCIIEPDIGCVQTDSLGEFTYENVPKNQRVRVAGAKSPYFPIESLIDTTDMDGVLNTLMIGEGIISAGLGQVGVTFDNTLPAISVTVRDISGMTLAGYTVGITPAGVGEGPYYLNASGLGIDQAATSTTASGSAFIVNLNPGTYGITVGGPTTCNAAFITENANNHTAPLLNPAQFVIVFDC